MATNQHAFQPNTDTSQQFSFRPEPSTIDLEHVSISQLLGRDYIFISSHIIELSLKTPATMHNLLNDLIEQLELTEAHTVAVSVDESHEDNPAFTRHDLTWYKHKVCRIESTTITNQEQYEFMEMIWRCSTAAISA